MNNKAVDTIQQQLTQYACGLNYETLSADAVHTAKARIIDTLGALIGGFFGPPSQVARDLAAQFPNSGGATVIGTRMKTTTDIAAFVNATTARYVEMTDFYHWPGSAEGHPSDVAMPVLAVAEHTRATGRDLITAVVLAYEVYSRISDVFRNPGFDPTNFACLGTAVGAAKLMGLSADQVSHCISMAIVPNGILRQVRTGHLSMFKAAAAGQAGRAGVFAAMLAQAGMEGPHLPFEGKAGWCDHVAGNRFSLDTLGGGDTRFKILDAEIKLRPSVGNTISSILAAEKVAPINPGSVEKVTVELYKRAKERVGTGEHCWNPQSRETADHSVPYVVAATLIDGTVTPRSFNDAHLWNSELRELMQKIDVVENPEFTAAYARVPPQHLSRVTVITARGERLIGESGRDPTVQSQREKDGQIDAKFRGLAEEVMGTNRTKEILRSLWRLEELDDVAQIPPSLSLE